MKIRDGFVSNSSSSSFLIVGTSDERLIERIIKAKDLTMEEVNDGMNFGVYDGGDISFFGYEDPCYAGREIVEEEIDSKPLLFVKQNLVNLLDKKYKIKVPIEHIHLLYGECGSG